MNSPSVDVTGLKVALETIVEIEVPRAAGTRRVPRGRPIAGGLHVRKRAGVGEAKPRLRNLLAEFERDGGFLIDPLLTPAEIYEFNQRYVMRVMRFNERQRADISVKVIGVDEIFYLGRQGAITALFKIISQTEVLAVPLDDSFQKDRLFKVNA